MFPSRKTSDPKNEGAKRSDVSARIEPIEGKDRGINSNNDKGVKSSIDRSGQRPLLSVSAAGTGFVSSLRLQS